LVIRSLMVPSVPQRVAEARQPRMTHGRQIRALLARVEMYNYPD
jgi:hypothetical protein